MGENVNQALILVTGAGGGMGRLATRSLAGKGCQVAELDVNEQGILEQARNAV